MKLKTLKEIEHEMVISECMTDMCCKDSRDEEIRQEAIKWIKSDIEMIRKLKKFNISGGIGKNIPLQNILNEDMGFIRTWMERFNITEDNLKGGNTKNE